jgi:hypothetical protein
MNAMSREEQHGISRCLFYHERFYQFQFATVEYPSSASGDAISKGRLRHARYGIPCTLEVVVRSAECEYPNYLVVRRLLDERSALDFQIVRDKTMHGRPKCKAIVRTHG